MTPWKLLTYEINHNISKTASKWIYGEFVIKSGSKMTLERVNQYFKNTSAKDFPITLVAIDDNKCIGTVSLFENDRILKIYFVHGSHHCSLNQLIENRGLLKTNKSTFGRRWKTRIKIKKLSGKQLYFNG